MRMIGSAIIAVALVTTSVPAAAQDQGPKPAVRAKTAMASAAHPDVTQAMVDVLRKGGNAMDAALTAVILQPVIEPQMTTLAGGMSILYYEAKTGTYHYLDAELDHTSKDAPITSSWTSMTGGGAAPVPETSGRRIGVPGTVAGIKAAADRFGTLEWADYFQPAIRVAERGFPMYSFLYGEMAEAAMGRLAAYPSGREEFIPDGYVPPVGAIVKRPRLAATMKRIAAEGPDYFYTGEWGRKFVAETQRTGGSLSLEDMAGYKTRWLQPTRTTFHGYEIVSAPPPSTAGTLISIILNVLEPIDLKAKPHFSQSAESFATVRRAFAFAESATDSFVRDPLSYDVPTTLLTSKQYAAPLTALIQASAPKPALLAAATESEAGMQLAARFDGSEKGDRHSTDTDHVVVVDRHGNMASVTHTVYGSTFATGLVVDGVGVNSGNGFPGTSAGPGRRVVSPFPPTMVAKDGKPMLVLGSPGLSSRAVALTLINRLGYGMEIEQAVDAPRFQGSQIDSVTAIETRVPENVRDTLRRVYGVNVRATTPYNWHFGSIHAIERAADGTLIGVADPRRGGAAKGY